MDSSCAEYFMWMTDVSSHPEPIRKVLLIVTLADKETMAPRGTMIVQGHIGKG